MVERITHPVALKEVQDHLIEVIAHSKKFAEELKKSLSEYDVDVDRERKVTVDILGVLLQKWVVEIIHILFIGGSARFNDLKRNLKGISSRTLSIKLRILEDAGFVKRRVVKERPTIVEYVLTERGQTFAELSCPIICYLKMERL
jgi:DNA-binding HxlR family transcriptional regulator